MEGSETALPGVAQSNLPKFSRSASNNQNQILEVLFRTHQPSQSSPMSGYQGSSSDPRSQYFNHLMRNSSSGQNLTANEQQWLSNYMARNNQSSAPPAPQYSIFPYNSQQWSRPPMDPDYEHYMSLDPTQSVDYLVKMQQKNTALDVRVLDRAVFQKPSANLYVVL